MRVEPAERLPAIPRAELHPRDHARKNAAPALAPGFARALAQPEVSTVHLLEARRFEEHPTHFPRALAVIAPDTEEGVIAQLLLQEFRLRVQTFLRAQHVRIE